MADAEVDAAVSGPVKRDLLATCHTEGRSKYLGMAKKAERGRKDAIRLKCLECCCWNPAEVKRCHLVDCALWPFRLGRLPLAEGAPKRPGPPQQFRKGAG